MRACTRCKWNGMTIVNSIWNVTITTHVSGGKSWNFVQIEIIVLLLNCDFKFIRLDPIHGICVKARTILSSWDIERKIVLLFIQCWLMALWAFCDIVNRPWNVARPNYSEYECRRCQCFVFCLVNFHHRRVHGQRHSSIGVSVSTRLSIKLIFEVIWKQFVILQSS